MSDAWLEQERFLQSRIEALEAEVERFRAEQLSFVKANVELGELLIDALARIPDPDDLQEVLEMAQPVSDANIETCRRVRATLPTKEADDEA